MIGLIDQNDERGGAPLYQLKITLKSSKPPIWRRVVVRSDMKPGGGEWDAARFELEETNEILKRMKV